jgi:hypothetical protein
MSRQCADISYQWEILESRTLATYSVELKSALVVTEFAFSERVVVIEIVVERLADEILQDMLEVMYMFCKRTYQTM